MNEDLHKPRAERYASAIATAAAADARIKELVETLADHEWHRSQAEAQVEYLRERLDLGDQQLIASTDEAPDREVRGLLCLATGRAWVRLTRHDGSDDPVHWVKAAADPQGQMQYEWPIADAGPFIALPDAWDYAQMNRDARANDEARTRIRKAVREMDGYNDNNGSAPWTLPELAGAVERVILAQRQRHAQTLGEVHELKATVRSLTVKLEQSEAVSQ